jgi:hypothetical protein
MHKILAATLGLYLLWQAPQTQAQTTEERFQDLFVTAGYATAFGAALGTAILGLTENPADNLQYIAVGASLGFIGGSLLGSYVVFAPVVSNGLPVEHQITLDGSGKGLTVRPHFDITGSLTAVEAGATLFSF